MTLALTFGLKIAILNLIAAGGIVFHKHTLIFACFIDMIKIEHVVEEIKGRIGVVVKHLACARD